MPPHVAGSARSKNRAPELEEMANCRPFLDQQIDIVRPP